MNSKYDKLKELLSKIYTSKDWNKQDVADAINELNAIGKKGFDSAEDLQTFKEFHEQVVEIKKNYTEVREKALKIKQNYAEKMNAQKSETEEVQFPVAKAEKMEVATLNEPTFDKKDKKVKKNRLKEKLKKIFAAVGLAGVIFGGASLLDSCDLERQNQPVEATFDNTLDDATIEGLASIENTESQINMLSGLLNNTRGYGNNLGADVMYDAFLVSNVDAVFANKSFMASLNYYNATGSNMMVNTINAYRQLSRANQYMVYEDADMLLYGNVLFSNQKDREFVNKVQQMSYDILKLAPKTDDASKSKVEELTKGFNDLLVNSDFKTTSEYSDQAKLYALIFAGSTHSELQSLRGEGIFTDAVAAEFLDAVKDCESNAKDGQLEDLTGIEYFKQLNKIENLGDDLRSYANGKQGSKLTRDEIVSEIEAKVTTKSRSENELHGIKDYGKELIGHATVKTDKKNNQHVSAGNVQSGGIVKYPDGKQEEGTKTEVVVDPSRGEEVIEEHEEDNILDKDGKVEEGHGAISGEHVTINPGGKHDDSLPDWDGNIDIPKPGEEIGTPEFQPIGNQNETPKREEVIDEEIIDGPSLSARSSDATSTDTVAAMKSYLDDDQLSYSVDASGNVIPIFTVDVQDTEDLGKTR